jgi:hypothetical protein
VWLGEDDVVLKRRRWILGVSAFSLRECDDGGVSSVVVIKVLV